MRKIAFRQKLVIGLAALVLIAVSAASYFLILRPDDCTDTMSGECPIEGTCTGPANGAINCDNLNNQDDPDVTDSDKPNNIQAQQQAIEAAKNFIPDRICLTVITPATHIETGAKYDFPSNCLAPGWQADTREDFFNQDL